MIQMIQMARRSVLRPVAILLAILAAPSSALRADDAAVESTIVFICLHAW